MDSVRSNFGLRLLFNFSFSATLALRLKAEVWMARASTFLMQFAVGDLGCESQGQGK